MNNKNIYNNSKTYFKIDRQTNYNNKLLYQPIELQGKKIDKYDGGQKWKNRLDKIQTIIKKCQRQVKIGQRRGQNILKINKNQQKHNIFVSVMLLEETDNLKCQIQNINKQIQQQNIYSHYLQNKIQNQQKQIDNLMKIKYQDSSSNNNKKKVMGSIQIQNDVYVWRQKQNQMRKKQQHQGIKLSKQQHQGIKLSCGKNNKKNNNKKNISYCDIVRSEIQTKQAILNHKLSCLQIKRPFKNTINPQYTFYNMKQYH